MCSAANKRQIVGRGGFGRPATTCCSGAMGMLQGASSTSAARTACVSRVRLTLSGSKPATRRRKMIKVSVMYPNLPGARFDHEYYREKHMPLVKARMGDSCKYYTVDKGIGGGAPGAPATYVGMCHIYCDSVEAFQAGFGPHAKEIMADIPNYTDQSPVIQVSEVVVV
jgi:uncharacterized protein (TIGR02118 family)